MNRTGNHVTAIFAEAMLAADPINFHPLRNDRTTGIAAADLIPLCPVLAHELPHHDVARKTVRFPAAGRLGFFTRATHVGVAVRPKGVSWLRLSTRPAAP